MDEDQVLGVVPDVSTQLGAQKPYRQIQVRTHLLVSITMDDAMTVPRRVALQSARRHCRIQRSSDTDQPVGGPPSIAFQGCVVGRCYGQAGAVRLDDSR